MNLAQTLFTEEQYEQLIKNGGDESVDKDYPPVAKLFMVNTACTWLISELDPEAPEIAFGLCDLGVGFPEMGYVSLRELEDAQTDFCFLVRDIFFKPEYPLSVYVQAARNSRLITEDDADLQQAQLQLKL